MTIDKASERYHIPAELLWEYESWGLCGGVKKVMGARRYDDRDMERLSMVMTLKNGGRSQKDWLVYFSWSGNTENVANSIKDQIGSDIFEIVPQTSYSDDYDTVVDLAREEQRTDARPEISGSIDNIAQYDVIYVGYPNWWGDMPMILYTFFDTYDLSGKTVVPFVTSGGSGFSDTISTIRRLESGASVLEGLSLSSSLASDPGSDVADWLTGLGLVK